LGYFWASLLTPLGRNFNASLATRWSTSEQSHKRCDWIYVYLSYNTLSPKIRWQCSWYGSLQHFNEPTRTAHGYLLANVRTVRWIADIPGRKHLHSAASSSLAIPATRRSTIGDRTFVVAEASVWNKLPQEIRTATSLPVFRRRLKTHLSDCD